MEQNERRSYVNSALVSGAADEAYNLHVSMAWLREQQQRRAQSALDFQREWYSKVRLGPPDRELANLVEQRDIAVSEQAYRAGFIAGTIHGRTTAR